MVTDDPLETLAAEISSIAQQWQRLRMPEALVPRSEALSTLQEIRAALKAQASIWGNTPQIRHLSTAARRLQQSLLRADKRLFRSVRRRVQGGKLRGPALRTFLDVFTEYRANAVGYRHLRREALDRLLEGILVGSNAPERRQPPGPEMLSYQPTPASLVLEMVDHHLVSEADIFYDLGTGLGLVPMLVHLLTGAVAQGIEIEASYCQHAQTQVRRLRLREVTIRCGDVRQANFTDGTVFYLFTPFVGRILEQVMTQLSHVAAHHPIRICSYGPCTASFAQQQWLRSANDHDCDPFRLAVFHSMT